MRKASTSNRALYPQARSFRRRHTAGATLVEVLVSVCLFIIGFAAVTVTSQTCLGILRRQRETIAATHVLQERLEQARAAGWNKLTTATSLRDVVMSIPSTHVRYLQRSTERIKVSAYPPSSATPAIEIERADNGVLSIVSGVAPEFSLRELLAVRVDVHVDWTSADGHRSRSAELSSVIALGGLLQ